MYKESLNIPHFFFPNITVEDHMITPWSPDHTSMANDPTEDYGGVLPLLLSCENITISSGRICHPHINSCLSPPPPHSVFFASSLSSQTDNKKLSITLPFILSTFVCKFLSAFWIKSLSDRCKRVLQYNAQSYTIVKVSGGFKTVIQINI